MPLGIIFVFTTSSYTEYWSSTAEGSYCRSWH